MLANALLVIGSFVFAAALLEIFLSERQKAKVAAGLTHFWYWLDEMRKPSLALWVQKPWPRRTLVGLCVLFGVWLSYGMFLMIPFMGQYLDLSAAAIDPKFLPQPQIGAENGVAPPTPDTIDIENEESESKVRRILGLLFFLDVPRAHGPINWSTRTILLVALPLLGTLVGLAFGFWMTRRITKSPSYIQPTILFALVVFVTSLRLLGLRTYYIFQFGAIDVATLIAHFMIPFLMPVLFMWLIVVIPMAIGLLASSILTVLEFFVRRIVEYPKGPILALGAVFAATGAFLKAVTG
jgi:hypothetical protein